MCGIFGRFARSGGLGSIDALVDATNLLSHRGPDDGGWWSEHRFFLGHRRLSIIDLQQGAQPMATADGRLVITFNGEIYNFVELQQELRKHGAVFSTNSDTEVILNGYALWGTGVLERLEGMFAFAIADRVTGTLLLARDRFGEKPLFVAETNEGVTFASEVVALAALADVDRPLDETALLQYLCLNYVPGERTMIAGIRRLPPGSWRLYSPKDVRQSFYWRASAAEMDSPPRTLQTAVGELRTRLDRAVRIATRSDVPVTLFLSGGIDSSVVAESAVRQANLKHAYCLDFAESSFSELRNADLVARKLGIELRRVVLSSDAVEALPEIIAHADDPLADSSALAVWTLSQAVARDYKVAISGDGADEVFGGYLTYKATALHRLITWASPAILRRLLARSSAWLRAGDTKVSTGYKLKRFLRAIDLPPSEAHFTWNGTWLPAEAGRFLCDASGARAAASALHDLAASHGLPARPPLAALQRADATDYLPNDILTKVDRMTMAHGLESRAPYLHPAVAEYALGLPADLKLRPFGPPKRILREAAREIYGPEIAAAKKQGFSIPVHRWLRGPLRPAAEELLSREAVDALRVLDTDAVLRAKERHMAGDAQLGFELWGLMVLVGWHRVRIQRRPSPRRPPTPLRQVRIPLAASAGDAVSPA